MIEHCPTVVTTDVRGLLPKGFTLSYAPHLSNTDTHPQTDEQITLMFSSSPKYKCPKTDVLFSPESVYKLMRLSQEQRSPGRVLGRGAGGTWDEKSTVPLPSSGSLPGILLPVSSQPCPTLPLSTPHVREEQKGAKAREPISPRVMEFQNLMTS